MRSIFLATGFSERMWEAVSYKRPACLCGVTLDDTVCGFVRSVPVGNWQCDFHKGQNRVIAALPLRPVRIAREHGGA